MKEKISNNKENREKTEKYEYALLNRDIVLK